MKTKPFDYHNSVHICILKASEDGMAQTTVKLWLEEAGIPCRFGSSPYIGHYDVIVPKRYGKRATRILL